MIFSEHTADSIEKRLPYSKMVYPRAHIDRLKYTFWRVYTPLHPYFRDIALSVGLVSHVGRQNYLVGKIAPGETLESIIECLVDAGYGNHFIAWKDDGELASLRKLVGFEYQYHIRIFADGEIRGHYEYTPEYKPILHWRAVNQRDCSDVFRTILRGKIV
jgi:hypothetical protein